MHRTSAQQGVALVRRIGWRLDPAARDDPGFKGNHGARR